MLFISQKIGRRDFIALSAGAAAAWCVGCATNPVTGRKQVMLLSEGSEIEIDRQNAPHQFSADYGAIQQPRLNEYLTQICKDLAQHSHRPHCPYACCGVNATYVNAYTFPAGAMAVTRGMLLAMESEAELAAVLGHEIGHVCSRHAAGNMTRRMLTGALMAGVNAYVQSQHAEYANIAAGVGMVAGGALLSRYSREDERQADALSLEYMTRAGYTPAGCIALMDILRKMSKNNPGLIELMFATHPMSEERYQTATRAVATKYQHMRSLPDHRERYLDMTAPIRSMREAIHFMQKGDQALAAGKPDKAASSLEAALRLAPDDYAGLLMLAKCRLAQNRAGEARRLAESARQVYPTEAQAWHIVGLACLAGRHYAEALDNFNRYNTLLPGNPLNVFFRGFALENLQRRPEAAQRYMEFLQHTREGEQAQHAYRRLVEWGYIRTGA
ncbi:MAG: M48 family metalloprotease [Kiritimatiellia bacterium]